MCLDRHIPQMITCSKSTPQSFVTWEYENNMNNIISNGEDDDELLSKITWTRIWTHGRWIKWSPGGWKPVDARVSCAAVRLFFVLYTSFCVIFFVLCFFVLYFLCYVFLCRVCYFISFTYLCIGICCLNMTAMIFLIGYWTYS